MKKNYITFQFPCGISNYNRVAIECKDIKEMQLIASDVYSLDGVRYIRFNKSGRLQKDVNVITSDCYLNENWIKYIER